MAENSSPKVQGNQKSQGNKGERTVDARELVREPGYTDQIQPEELLTNPAVTPQTIQEPSDVRDDLRT